jgi:hypothetical protein
VLLACLLLGAARLSRAAEPVPGECAPPHSLVALLPLADLTDRTWELWSGESPAVLVARLLADSLEHGRGRHVLRVPLVADADPALPLSRAADDDPALRAARRAEAEFAISGSVSVLTHEDTREGGRFARWGMGAPDARTHVRVSVTLRVLDTRDGSVIIESNASRDRAGRGTASVGRPEPAGRNPNPTDDPLVDEVLGEVLSDLTSTVDQRLDASWRARVILEGRGIYVLDAGASRGLFPGERLDVWRPGIQLFDEDMLHIGDDTRIGSVVVEALDGRGRARARLVEGDARMGDLVRPCSGASGPAVSLRR